MTPGLLRFLPCQPQSELKIAWRVLGVLSAEDAVAARRRKARVVQDLEEVGIEPEFDSLRQRNGLEQRRREIERPGGRLELIPPRVEVRVIGGPYYGAVLRSEEHTSELQSLRHLVCRLLLEK